MEIKKTLKKMTGITYLAKLILRKQWCRGQNRERTSCLSKRERDSERDSDLQGMRKLTL